MQLIKRIFLLLAMIIATNNAAAVYCGSGPFFEQPAVPGGIDILFLNGINNSLADAQCSANYIRDKITTQLNNQYPGIRVGLIYNPAGGYLGLADTAELIAQANYEAIVKMRTNDWVNLYTAKFPKVVGKSLEKIKTALSFYLSNKLKLEWSLQQIQWSKADPSTSVVTNGGGMDIGQVITSIVIDIEGRLLSGRRVVIVAHSQGNLFIEAAYALLAKRRTAEQMSRLQVVGVAVVASSSPNNRWVTIAEDKAVFLAYPIATNGVGQPLGQQNNPPGNFDAYALAKGGLSLGTALATFDLGVSNVYGRDNVLTWDPVGHNFIDIYMNDGIRLASDYNNPNNSLLARVTSLVKDAIDHTAPAVTPPAPTGVSVTAGNGQATISWNAVSGATSYNLYQGLASGVTKNNQRFANVTTPFSMTAMTNGTTYYYVVTAVNANGESSVSSEISVTPQVTCTPPQVLNLFGVCATPTTTVAPAAPTGVTATAGDGQVTVSWNAVSGATSYKLYYSLTSPVYKSDLSLVGVISPQSIPNLTNGRTYFFAVTAVNVNGESGISSTVSVTPHATSGTTSPFAGNWSGTANNPTAASCKDWSWSVNIDANGGITGTMTPTYTSCPAYGYYFDAFGVVTSSNGATSVHVNDLGCTWSGTLVTTPSRRGNGTFSCDSGNGTWIGQGS